MKYAHIEETTQKLLGWYDKEIHTEIPTPNIKITDEQWQNAINNGHNKVNINGSTEMFDFRTEMEKTKQELLQKINEAKLYLSETDYKMTVDYDKDTSEVKIKRQEARDFIRESEAKNG